MEEATEQKKEEETPEDSPSPYERKRKRPKKGSTVVENEAIRMRDGDTLCRVNYLYQLAHAAYPIEPALARNYIKEMRAVARKHVVRIDPSIKHTFCGKCNELFFMSPATKFAYCSAESSSICEIMTGCGVEEERQDRLQVKCGHCGANIKLYKLS